MKIDFTDTAGAVDRLRDELLARLRERQLGHDARVELAIAGLSNDEATMLKVIVDQPVGNVWGRPGTRSVDFFGMASIPRRWNKQLIRAVGQFEKGHPACATTPVGR